MEPRGLRYFEVTARHEHLGVASAELGISESTLSRSIARLEKTYGPLFDRVGRGVRLNAAGRVLLTRVARALAELENAEAEIRDLRASGATQISLGFVPTLGSSVVPDFVAGFKRLHPTAQFRFVQAARDRLHHHLMRGDIDLCLAATRFSEDAIEWRALWDEELVAVVPHVHRLARRRLIAVRELALEPLLTYTNGHALRTAVDDLALRAGFVPNIVFEADDAPTLLGLVGVGMGITLLPDSIQANRGRSAVVRLRASRWRTVGLSWMSARYQPPIVSEFRDFIAGGTRNLKRALETR